MKPQALLASVFAATMSVQAAQGTVLYNQTFNMGATKGTFDAFGVNQNQTGGNAAQLWVFGVDNLNYSTQIGDVVTQESQSFSSDPSAAGWAGNADASTAPNNFGYQPAGTTAGGPAGEMGGTISRGAAGRGYFADATIGSIDLSQNLVATGTLFLDGAAANNSFNLGWLDLSVANSDRRLGFTFTESNTNVLTNARITIGQIGSGGNTTSSSIDVANISNKVLYWSLTYNAATNEITGLIQDTPIPEPASLSLIALGALLALRRV